MLLILLIDYFLWFFSLPLVRFFIFFLNVYSMIKFCGQPLYMQPDTDPDLLRYIEELKRTVEYWQNDMDSLNKEYKERNYENLNSNDLSPEDLEHKAQLKEYINDGKKCIKDTIKQLKQAQDSLATNNNNPQDSSLLGKRSVTEINELSENIDYKRKNN